MGNYDRMLAFGQRLFLEWDQEEIIRCRNLRADAGHIYIRYLGKPYSIDRSSGFVSCLDNGSPATPAAALTIFDYICRDNFQPGMSGRRCAANSLKHVAQSSPDTVSLHQKRADFFQLHIPALHEALTAYPSFPKGDAACLFPVFDGIETVFQFWEGDEEFPPSVRFLWDENILSCLKYETLYYVMGAFLDRIINCIGEIEKNVK